MKQKRCDVEMVESDRSVSIAQDSRRRPANKPTRAGVENRYGYLSYSHGCRDCLCWSPCPSSTARSFVGNCFVISRITHVVIGYSTTCSEHVFPTAAV